MERAWLGSCNLGVSTVEWTTGGQSAWVLAGPLSLPEALGPIHVVSEWATLSFLTVWQPQGCQIVYMAAEGFKSVCPIQQGRGALPHVT